MWRTGAIVLAVGGLAWLAYSVDPSTFGGSRDPVVEPLSMDPRRNQPATPQAVLDGESEPTVGTVPAPLPGSETKPRNPNEPYDPGPPEARVPIGALSAEERAYVERLRAQDHGNVNAMYAQASAQRGHQAKGAAAGIDLGLHNLDELGVVR